MDERLIRPTELAPLDGRENLAAVPCVSGVPALGGELIEERSRGCSGHTDARRW